MKVHSVLVGLCVLAGAQVAYAHDAPFSKDRPRGSLAGFGLSSKTGVSFDNGAFAMGVGGVLRFPIIG